jgi:hypothetical protein
VSATDNQHQHPTRLTSGRQARQTRPPGAAHNVFLPTALLIGGLTRVAAILVAWSLGKYL